MTSLGDGRRVSKTELRIAVLGAIDELNAALGVAVAGMSVAVEQRGLVQTLQNDLFDLGADLCLPAGSEGPSASGPPPLRLTAEYVLRLEQWIDTINGRLNPLRSFILPGGTPLAAQLHLARTICRRAELSLVRLHESEPVNPLALTYVNRLSDLLFVMARQANDDGRGDILWRPGGATTP
jgi:cob(I)alamin adenosyltransferase